MKSTLIRNLLQEQISCNNLKKKYCVKKKITSIFFQGYYFLQSSLTFSKKLVKLFKKGPFEVGPVSFSEDSFYLNMELFCNFGERMKLFAANNIILYVFCCIQPSTNHTQRKCFSQGREKLLIYTVTKLNFAEYLDMQNVVHKTTSNENMGSTMLRIKKNCKMRRYKIRQLR